MKIFSSLRGVSALALFVACITGTDDPDFAVTFDDLAEFASAFHRRSDFHFHFSFVSPGLSADGFVILMLKPPRPVCCRTLFRRPCSYH